MTKTAATFGAAVLFALSSHLGAQEPRPQASSDALTLTGCLDRAPNGTYQLLKAHIGPLGNADAKDPSGTTSGAIGTSGTTGVASAAGAPVNDDASTWILKSTTDLAPHVGHSIEVTGRPSFRASSNESDTATTSPPTTTATGARMKENGENTKSVDVQTVRMLSRSCS